MLIREQYKNYHLKCAAYEKSLMSLFQNFCVALHFFKVSDGFKCFLTWHTCKFWFLDKIMKHNS